MLKVVLCFALLATGINGIPFEDCGSRYDLRQVNIEGCPTAPCVLRIKSNVNVTVVFYANFGSLRLVNDVIFFLQNIEIDAEVTQHTCQLGSSATDSKSCILAPAQLVQFKAEVTVDEGLPPFPGQLVWKIFNEKNTPLICFKVTVILEDE